MENEEPVAPNQSNSSPFLPPIRNLKFWFNTIFFFLAIYFTSLAIFPIQRVAEALEFPYQLDAEEGFLLGQSLRLTSGEGMYLPILKPPYVVDNYPPLYPAIWSLAGRSGEPSLAPGRCIVAIASIALALGIATIIVASTGSIALGWLCPFLFLTSWAFLRWGGYARVDLPAIALSVWGLAIFGLWGRRSRWAFGISVALFALSLFMKQTSLIAPLACFIYLLTREWRRALWFAIALGLAVGIPTALLCLWTRGEYYLHTITYNKNVMHWGELRGWAGLIWILNAPLLISLGILFLRNVFELFHKSKNFSVDEKTKKDISLFLIYVALGVLSLLSLAKAGAAENYLLEPACAAVIFLGVTLGKLIRNKNRDESEPDSQASRKWEIAVAFVVTAFLLLHAFRFYDRHFEQDFFAGAPRPSPADLIQGDRVVREIMQRPGPVLCEEPIYTLTAGRTILFQHFIMTQLAEEGKWDPSPIAQMAARGEFSLVATHQDLFNENQFFDRYPPSFRKAFRERYVLLDFLNKGRLQPIYLYVPQEKTRE